MGKGAKNRATVRIRTACEKDAGKMEGQRGFFHQLFPLRAFPHYLNAWDRLRGETLFVHFSRVFFACCSRRRRPILRVFPHYLNAWNRLRLNQITRKPSVKRRYASDNHEEPRQVHGEIRTSTDLSTSVCMVDCTLNGCIVLSKGDV